MERARSGVVQDRNGAKPVTANTAPVEANHARTPRSVLAIQRAAGNGAAVVAVQRHAVEPERSPEEEEEQGASAQRIPLQRVANEVTIQRWDIRKAWKEYRHPEQGAYNVRRGEALPGPKEMAKETLEETGRVKGPQIQYAAEQKHTETAWEVLREEGLLEGMRASLEEERTAKGQTGPTTADYLDVRLTAGNVLAKSWYYGLQTVNKKVLTELKDGGGDFGAKAALWSLRIVPEIQKRSAQKVIESGDLPPDAKYFDPSNPTTSGMVDRFLEKRKGVKLEHAYVPKEAMKPFSDALKLLPTVEFLLEGQKQGGNEAPQGDGTPKWKDGGSLTETITPVDDATLTPGFMRKKRIASKTFRTKTAAVDAFIKNIVSPEFLKRVPKPKVFLHTKSAQGWLNPTGFRASASGGELNVSHNEAKNVIAHEVGHAIETYLPMRYWHDMHLMLGARHEAAGGGGAKSGENFITKYTEGRHGGKYVTGKYTSTAYRSGQGEVVSMAFQFFMDPAKALKLIEGDPMHAALVLKAFKPEEYKSVDELRPFDKYLPHK